MTSVASKHVRVPGCREVSAGDGHEFCQPRAAWWVQWPLREHHPMCPGGVGPASSWEPLDVPLQVSCTYADASLPRDWTWLS